MKINQAFPSKYLKADDLQGQSYRLTINHVVIEEVGTDAKPQTKPVIYFREAGKGLVLNRTNADTIAIVLGDETDNWVGHVLEVFSMRVQGPNGMVDGIRCRVVVPQQVIQPPLGAPATPTHGAPINRPAPQSALNPNLGGVVGPAAGIDRTVGAQGIDEDFVPF